ncbi:MAG TPA: TRAP transporter small permease [Mesorhizobium sp.]|jgi:TRAP-type C4-dicarboxylate transport system permease small subunit|nr:TRAP transporter small permease [Mesorhizobium sp.]
MRALRTLWTVVERLATALLILGVALMTAASLAQVFSRYVLGDPLSWSEEFARFAFVWVSYLAAWLAWKHRAHIAVDAVQYLGSPGLNRASALFVEAAVLAFCVYTFWTNMTLVGLAWTQPSPSLSVPMGLVYVGYNVMAALIAGDILVGWLAGRPRDADEAVPPAGLTA